MDKKALLNEVRDLYERRGGNITEYLTNSHQNKTLPEDLMISYDIRSGNDIKNYMNNPKERDAVVHRIADCLNSLSVGIASILECGSGEGLNLTILKKFTDFNIQWMRGMDISWSRAKIASNYARIADTYDNLDFFVGDIFHIPLAGNSVDIVFTMQGIAEMGGHERELVKELYRVANKYLVLIEPCYEIAGDEGRARMKRLNYVRGLKDTAEDLGYRVIRYEPFGADTNPLNPAALLVIEKTAKDTDSMPAYICPWTHEILSHKETAWYAEKSLLAYPVLNGIPMLNRENAIVASKIARY